MSLPIPADLKRTALCAKTYDPTLAPQWETKNLCRAFLDIGAADYVVTFEGTRPDFAMDWITDLDQMPLALDPGLGILPDGFGRAVFSVLLRIIKTVGNVTLGFNGHSMGGANALIAAAAWKLAGYKLGRVTAFEPPRVGTLGNLLDGEAVLITRTGDDPVTEVPPFKAHPAMPIPLDAAENWSSIDCHEIANVTSALAAYLAKGS